MFAGFNEEGLREFIVFIRTPLAPKGDWHTQITQGEGPFRASSRHFGVENKRVVREHDNI